MFNKFLKRNNLAESREKNPWDSLGQEIPFNNPTKGMKYAQEQMKNTAKDAKSDIDRIKEQRARLEEIFKQMK